MNKKVIIVLIVSIALSVVFFILLNMFIGHSKALKQTAKCNVLNETVKEVVVGKAVKQESVGAVKTAENLLNQNNEKEAYEILQETITKQSGTQEAYDSLLFLAAMHKGRGELLKAKELYQIAAAEYQDYCDYADVQKKIDQINVEIIFSPIITEYSEYYKVISGDTLIGIAKKYNTTVALIKKANGLETDVIRPGIKLKVLTKLFSVVVDKSRSTLTLLLNGSIVKTYVVSTGKNNSTPIGVFKISKDKLVMPIWYSPKGVVPPGSSDNLLGSRWMGITTPESGYGIHGTNDSESIGSQCTEGCIRMFNSDVEELYDLLPVGTDVEIID